MTGRQIVEAGLLGGLGAHEHEVGVLQRGRHRLEAGQGGFDYRYAVFSKFGCPEMPYKRDCDVIYSTDQKMLTTGTMLSPEFWTHIIPVADLGTTGETVLNRGFFNGLTTDD